MMLPRKLFGRETLKDGSGRSEALLEWSRDCDFDGDGERRMGLEAKLEQRSLDQELV